MRAMDRLQPLALLLLRLVLGAILAVHGFRKLYGAGLAHHIQIVSNLGFPAWMAYLSVLAEFAGGILVMAGLLTRMAALAILIDLAVAVVKVHWKNGLTGPAGYEFPLALAAAAFVVGAFGAGPLALDRFFSGRRTLTGGPRRR